MQGDDDLTQDELTEIQLHNAYGDNEEGEDVADLDPLRAEALLLGKAQTVDPGLDQIMSQKVRAGDPEFERLASHRRSDVYAHQNSKAAVGEVPPEGFLPPEEGPSYVAGSHATGFVCETKRRRRSP
jgi:hypothetical protein